eukprot:gene24214-29410_t
MAFWEANSVEFPVHAATFRGETGCVKGTSANVEQTFSGAGVLMGDFHAHDMSAELFESYMIVRGNWKYKFLRPSVKQVADRYKHKYGGTEPATVGVDEE